MPHPALRAGSVAVVTGGASGIGLEAAARFADFGMAVVIVDIGADRLEDARREVSSRSRRAVVHAFEADVSDRPALDALAAEMDDRYGGVDVLMNNAGIGARMDAFGEVDVWRRVLEVNLWGVINGTQAFGPAMAASGRPGLIINTGSKQGITTPPGSPAYNVSKAGVKAYTEALEHQLRNTEGCKVSAHLLIPGYVFTGMTAGDQVEKPPSAWTPAETVDFMLTSLDKRDFYILCPDNDVPRELDEKRILWAAGDIVENRPPLSRWHPDYGEAFAAFIKR
ncbi:SDR family NAD(P)-dependent oxidoreductase [Phenylobacterium immobile]|uniref:SDR family NAD(P)-dependent oxidoreductase n=1 Tax=Phenylobacterium immobile TaxID=21 RepID=UPI000B075B38|nr:SDR family NAD(P)-dependent oxidoreductase [Phenylobacterium immobile]